EGDSAPGDAPVALQLRLARAAGADARAEGAHAAAEAFEVLPHAPHARQVVLELRQLDLQLPFGAPGVLGEDVEDQLRAVDDACLERVLERPLLGRLELVVDEQHLRARLAVGLLQLLELALAHVGSPLRVWAVLDELADPLAEGLQELRSAVAGWCSRRFGVELDPGTEIIPTYGSKEAIFLLALVVVDREAEKRLVVTTEPGYPVPDRGAAFAGAEVVQLPLLEAGGFLPDLDAVDPSTWEQAAIVWINYPNNPTGAVAPLEFLARLAELSREHEFLLACDEAYTELWFDSPPHSALEVRGLGNVAVFNTLSKRSP